MSVQTLFRSTDIQVTPVLARFGPITYQIAAIASVAVYHRPKLNPIAVTLVGAAVAAGAFAYFVREQQPDFTVWGAIAAIGALLLGVAWQRFRPVLEYRFVMRTAASETETVTTFDREQVLQLRQAIEIAFNIQHARAEEVRSARVESPSTAHMGPVASPELSPDEEFRITPDWRVAGVPR